MNVETTETKCLSAEGAEGDSELWHKSLRHINFKTLRHMSSKKLVHGLPKVVNEKSCEICMKGKQPIFLFASEVAPRAKHGLGVVHFKYVDHLKYLHLEETSTLCHLWMSSQE